MSKGLNNAFYINKLCLINTNPFLSQFMDDIQLFSIQKNKKERFIIKDIITKIKNKKEKKWKKQYKIK